MLQSTCWCEYNWEGAIWNCEIFISSYPELYTGHCFRRNSATLLVNNCADIHQLKRYGDWKSSTVAEGYVDDCLTHKIDFGKNITATELLIFS